MTLSQRTNWLRVNRSRRCPICDHADWCMVATDGSAAICPRTTSDKKAGEAGYLHRLIELPNRHQVFTKSVRLISPVPGMGEKAKNLVQEVDHIRLASHADQLGVTLDSLAALSIGWSQRFEAWSFPMSDANGKVIGIRLRKDDGGKFAIPGSKEGLFIPFARQIAEQSLLITEGPTDAAALWSLGFRHIIGRPSCAGGVRLLCEIARQRKPREVVIIADADRPGQLGANSLAKSLILYVPSIRIISPPDCIKDVRAWKRAGTNQQDILQAINQTKAIRLSIQQ